MKTYTKIDLNFPDFTLSQKELQEVANEVISMIKEKTSQGLDSDRKPFKPYSTRPIKVYNKVYKGGYAEYKSEKGIKTPNLKESGKLLNSIKSKDVSGDDFKVVVEGVSYAEKVFQDRPIMGLTNSEVEIIKDKILERMLKNE